MLGLATQSQIDDLQRQINSIRSGSTEFDLDKEEPLLPFSKLGSEPVEKPVYPTDGSAFSVAVRIKAAKDMRKQKMTAKEIAEVLKVSSGTVREYWKKRG